MLAKVVGVIGLRGTKYNDYPRNQHSEEVVGSEFRTETLHRLFFWFDFKG